MHHPIELPGIEHVKTDITDGEHCSMLTTYVHHSLSQEQMKQILHVVELLIPAMIRIGATL